MPQQIHSFNHILFAQEFIAAIPFDLSVEVVHEHMGAGPTVASAPRQHARREYSRHPTGSIWEVPTWAIDQNNVPRHVVNVVGKVVDSENAFREQEVLHRSALVADQGFGFFDELRHVGDLGGVTHVVGFDSRVRLFEPGDQELALVQIDCAAVEVEGVPEEGLVGETKRQKVAAGRAEAKSVGYGSELGGRHVRRVGRVRDRGGVVEESVGDGEREWSGNGGRG
ncbi:hypothetical protein F2P56_036839 [Juglans regia]|uniref:Uncharacterized protein n=1 Tax=Juglans regia TaxID=51240 RepID=A0A833WTM0_JUGRE|nr:hypothetical protein F2P56_036839 [Juglans regia]